MDNVTLRLCSYKVDNDVGCEVICDIILMILASLELPIIFKPKCFNHQHIGNMQ